MQIVLIDCGSKRIADLRSILLDSGVELASIPLNDANSLVNNNCHAGVISGGPHLFTGPDGKKLIEQFSFIDRFKRPLLGICLGHQAIGIRHGSDVYRGKANRGSTVIKLNVSHKLLKGINQPVILESDHCEKISCPESFSVVADSENCDNEIMANDKKYIYGIQAHPETSVPQGFRLIANFLTIVKDI